MDAYHNSRFPPMSERPRRSRHNSLDDFGGGGGGSRQHKSPRDQKSFVAREWSQCKKSVMVAGSKYNILISSMAGFVLTFVMLLIFRPVFIMRRISPDADENMEEYAMHPHHKPTTQSSTYTSSEYQISWGSVVIWSVVAGAAVAILTYFTCRKSPNLGPNAPLLMPSSSATL